QRIDATGDAELKAILAHNRDEEKEHASMVLEWLRRHDAAFDTALRQYLFTEGSIVGREEQATGDDDAAAGAATGAPAAGDGSLGIGSLRARKGWEMDDLLRSHAPISTAAWAAIDEQARRVLRVNLAARQLVDFKGPLGWEYGAISLGRVRELPPSAAPATPSTGRPKKDRGSAPEAS